MTAISELHFLGNILSVDVTAIPLLYITVDSKIIRAHEINHVKKLIPDAVL